MAFNTNSSNKNKNQFVASITSNRTGKTAIWLNPTDSFLMATLAKEIKHVSPEEAKAKILEVLMSDDFSLTVKDITAEQAVIPVGEF